jgi:hypothetical protein
MLEHSVTLPTRWLDLDYPRTKIRQYGAGGGAGYKTRAIDNGKIAEQLF